MRSMTPFLLLMLMPFTSHAVATERWFDQPAVELGNRLFQQHCATCHGAALEGQPDWQVPLADGSLPAPPHDETGHTWHHSNLQNFDYVKHGGAAIVKRLGIKGFTSAMPGFGETLSDEDIWNVLAYIRSEWPQDIRDLHASRNPPHE